MKIKELRKRLKLDKPELKYDLGLMISDLLIRTRIENGLTQEDLSKLANTKQPGIARAENGAYLPSLTLLKKLANSMGYWIEIKFIKK